MLSSVWGMTQAPFLPILASLLAAGNPMVSAMVYLVRFLAAGIMSSMVTLERIWGNTASMTLFTTAKSDFLSFWKHRSMISRWRSVLAKSVSILRSLAYATAWTPSRWLSPACFN